MTQHITLWQRPKVLPAGKKGAICIDLQPSGPGLLMLSVRHRQHAVARACLISVKRYGPAPPKIVSVDALVQNLKFSKCLPQLLAQAVITARSFEMEHALAVTEEPVVGVAS
jgi:hypothetical protein